MSEPQAPLFLYLHGFASSPSSTKARAFAGWAARHGVSLQVLDLRTPSFEHLLLSAMKAQVIEAIDAAGGPRARVVLIGSSLGGLTACRVAEADPRVSAVFLMAPAFGIASRWEARIGAEAWDAWKTSGFLEVDDHAMKLSETSEASGAERPRAAREAAQDKSETSEAVKAQRARVHWGFVEELARMDAAQGPFPDVRVPARIVHGTRDDIVDIHLSRTWSKGKRHVHLVEVDDTHELGASIPRILAEADDFFRPFLNP